MWYFFCGGGEHHLQLNTICSRIKFVQYAVCLYQSALQYSINCNQKSVIDFHLFSFKAQQFS
jgi:hypothetical protein